MNAATAANTRDKEITSFKYLVVDHAASQFRHLRHPLLQWASLTLTARLLRITGRIEMRQPMPGKKPLVLTAGR